MIVRDQTKLNRSIRQHPDPSTSHTHSSASSPYQSARTERGEKEKRANHSRLELLRKLLLVQKHIRIPVLLIKPILHLPHTKHDPVDIPVPRQRHNSSVRFPSRWDRLVFLHRVIIFRRNSVLIRRFAGRRAELAFYVRKRGRPTVIFVREAEDVVETDLFELGSATRVTRFLGPFEVYARV